MGRLWLVIIIMWSALEKYLQFRNTFQLKCWSVDRYVLGIFLKRDVASQNTEACLVSDWEPNLQKQVKNFGWLVNFEVEKNDLSCELVLWV